MKKILLSMLFSFFLVLSLSSQVFAASVGDKLTQPEDGWKRYDDSSKYVYYYGKWTQSPPTSGKTYNNSYSYSTDVENGKIRFRFYGTKIRYIGQTYTGQAKVVRINIDGNEETFTQQGANTYQLINYEKTNLAKGYHDVEVSFDDRRLMLDAIDIDEDGELIDINAPINLTALGNNGQATLKWDQVKDADSYTVYYGTASGVYTETVTATKDTYGNFVIPGLTNGTTYYFVVTASVDGVESPYSNEASATPQGEATEPEEPTTPSGDRAILVITMVNGLEKEYDLSMEEVNNFIDWYDEKDSGIGSSKFAIDKHNNNKGPFNSRIDYVIFNNILTFEINEY